MPPHLGNPRRRDQISPYPATSEEVCRKFATSPDRRTILQGWLDFRVRLTQFGIVSGFQWPDGSFLEDIEVLEFRQPRDLDLVTFFTPPNDPTFIANLFANFREFIDCDASKATYHLDHFPVNLAGNPLAVVEQTRYWTGLFSHRRDGLWKGMLWVELNTNQHDTDAAAFLATIA
jgi:hypothetical protein